MTDPEPSVLGRAFQAVLLWAFPPAFRERHGVDFRAFMALQRRERRYDGVVGLLRFVGTTSLDALRAGARARLAARRLRNDGVSTRRGLVDDGRGGWDVASIRHDIRLGVRTLLSAPLFSGVAVATLALGIGASTAIFTVVDGVLLRPMDFDRPGELAMVQRRGPDEDVGVSYPDFRDWRADGSGVSGLAATMESSATFDWDTGAEVISGVRATHDLFDVLGVRPMLGRPLTPEEDAFDGPEAVVISYGFWRSRLGSDPDVLSRTLPMDGERYPIVGVMPEGFSYPGPDVEFWAPMHEDRVLQEVGLPTGVRTLTFMEVIGRVEGGIPLSEAAARLSAVAARIDNVEGTNVGRDVRLVPLLESRVGSVRATLLLLFGAVGIVLLISCANVAGLALGRASARERELAVRTALGAGRGRLVQQLLAESLVISLVAGLLGLGLAWVLTDVLLAMAPEELPRVANVTLDGRVAAFGLFVSLSSGLLFGLLPALRSSRTDMARVLGDSSRGSSAGRAALRPQRILVVAQVMLAVVLLSGAGLLASSLLRLNRVEVGFNPDGVIMATISPTESVASTPEEIDGFYERLLGRIRATPGVRSASSTYSPPFASNEFEQAILLEGEVEEAEERGWVGTVIIRDGYFAMMEVPLLSGRIFDDGDRLEGPPVAIVNQTMAERGWPGEDPIGQRFKLAGGIRGTADSFDRRFFPEEWTTVVGVVGDVRRESMAEETKSEFYRPHSQITWTTQFLMIRTEGDPESVASGLRELVWSVDDRVPVNSIRSLRSSLNDSIAPQRFRSTLITAFAAIAALLSMVGVYATMALAVSRQTREIGIRLALGAESDQVLRGVLSGGVRLVGLGLVLGLGTAVLAGRLVESMLFEVTPYDPVTLLAVTLLTALVALLASYLPARRASRVDPVTSLQAE